MTQQTQTYCTWSQQPSFDIANEIFQKPGICGPRHISTTGITLHRTPKQADVLQERNGVGFLAEKVHQKEPVRIIVIPQHSTSVREPRHVVTPRQSGFVFRSNPNNIFNHCIRGKPWRHEHRCRDAHSGKGESNALWEWNAKWIVGVKQDSSDTHGGERKIGAIIMHRTHGLLFYFYWKISSAMLAKHVWFW